MKTLAIVGGSYAGVQTAISARDHGFDGRIVLFGAEPQLPYHRPPLSKDFLVKSTEISSLFLRSEDFYLSKHIELALGETVTGLDLTSKKLYTDTGASLPYDYFVLATGASNRLLSWQQSNIEGVYSLRNFEDAQNIKRAMTQAKKAVVVGGGFIGLELAASFVKQGIDTVLIERGSSLAHRVLSTYLSDYMAQQHKQRGVDIRCNTEVINIKVENGAVTAVVLQAGELIEADLVVVGVGATPNTQLLNAAGIDSTNGILVNRQGESVVPHVYAAGDCAQTEVTIDSQNKQNIRLESVHAANELGKAIGAHVAGGSKPFISAPWFWSDQYELKLQMVGIALATDQIVVRGDVSSNKFSVFHLRPNGELGAVQSVNSPAEHMLGRRLVEAGIKIESMILEDTSINLREYLQANQPVVN